MNIVWLITRGDSIGGAQIHVRDLALRAQADGHAVTVATGAAGPLTEQLSSAGIPTRIVEGMLREINPIHDVGAIRSVTDLLRDIRPNVISTHSSKAGIIGRIAARRAGVPAVFTAHGWAFTDGVPQPKRAIYRLTERATAPLARRIICVSRHDLALATSAGIASDRLIAIHNGMPDIAGDLRAHPDQGQPVRAVMTARFDRQKDHETLLRALLDVPDMHLDLVGDGPDHHRIAQRIRTLGLADRVHILGQRHDVDRILARAHLFVLSSHWEGFPRSTLEAMRAGLPVVVSDVGGAAEAIEEGTTGFVVPPSDRDALVARLTELSANPAMRKSMGDAGRQRYEALFTFDRMYDQTMEVLRAASTD